MLAKLSLVLDVLIGLPFTERHHRFGLQPDQLEPLGAKDSYDGDGVARTPLSECILLFEHHSFCCYVHAP